MLGDTDAERDPSKGIVKKGHATTLHSPIRINTKFGDRISAILQESVADRVINLIITHVPLKAAACAHDNFSACRKTHIRISV